MSDLHKEVLEILQTPNWDDDRKAREIVRAAQDCFQPLDAAQWDS